MKQNKLQLERNVKHRIDWQGITAIEDIKADIAAIEEQGGTHIEISTGYETQYVDFSAFKYEEETDEEYNARIENEKRHNERFKEIELKKTRGT